jgi:hypothetical protein
MDVRNCSRLTRGKGLHWSAFSWKIELRGFTHMWETTRQTLEGIGSVIYGVASPKCAACDNWPERSRRAWIVCINPLSVCWEPFLLREAGFCCCCSIQAFNWLEGNYFITNLKVNFIQKHPPIWHRKLTTETWQRQLMILSPVTIKYMIWAFSEI